MCKLFFEIYFRKFSSPFAQSLVFCPAGQLPLRLGISLIFLKSPNSLKSSVLNRWEIVWQAVSIFSCLDKRTESARDL